MNIYNTLKKHSVAMLGLGLFASSFTAMAAVQGQVGPQSEGEVDINAVISYDVIVNGLDDLDFGAIPTVGAVDVTKFMYFCIGSNGDLVEGVKVNIEPDNNDGTNYVLTGSQGNDLKYNLSFNTTAGGSFVTQLPSQEFIVNDAVGLVGISQCDPTPSSENFALFVTIPAVNSVAVGEGTYTGKVFVIVTGNV
jgi:hypothetical protein